MTFAYLQCSNELPSPKVPWQLYHPTIITNKNNSTENTAVIYYLLFTTNHNKRWYYSTAQK